MNSPFMFYTFNSLKYQKFGRNLIRLKQKEQRDLQIIRKIRSSSYPNEFLRFQLNGFYSKLFFAFFSGVAYGILNEAIDFSLGRFLD
ncbi:MAG: hypothetical protein MJ252_30455, partial [archaeon]|nr:hypothetical protein [archaeon]